MVARLGLARRTLRHIEKASLFTRPVELNARLDQLIHVRRPDFIVVLRVPGSQQQSAVSNAILAQRSCASEGRGPAGVGPAEIVSPVRTDVTGTARKMFSLMRLWSLQQHDYMRLRALVWRWRRRPVVLGCWHRVDPAMLRKAPLVPPVDRQ